MKKIIVLILFLKLLSFQTFAKDKIPLALIPFTNENNFALNYLILPHLISLRCLDCEGNKQNVDIKLDTYYTLDYMEYRATVSDGIYKISYKNIFNQNIEKIIKVDQNNYRINICVDSLAEYKVDLWNEFREFDTIKIIHIFQAHNYFKSTGVVIFKFKNAFIAEIHNAIPSDTAYEDVLEEFYHYSIGNNIIQRIILKEQEVKAFSRFEDELKTITNGGNWTSTDYYHYTRNNNEIVKYDNKNEWREFEFLKKKVFGE